MTPPGQAAALLLRAVALGAALGVWYGFLRPLRPRFTTAADLAFLAGCLWGWVYLAFGICAGDLRLGYLAGSAAGCLGWEMVPGRWLRPVFSKFWKLVAGILRFFLLPMKKFSKKSENFICICGKMGYNKME